MIDDTYIKVHQSHCCVLHGCKYGDEECPVVNKTAVQLYRCEDCYDRDSFDYEIEPLYRFSRTNLENFLSMSRAFPKLTMSELLAIVGVEPDFGM